VIEVMTPLSVSDINSQIKFNKTLNENNVFCVPIRFIVAALTLLATVVLYICRINLSTAIVVMSNYTKSDTISGTDVCPSAESSGSKNWKQNEGEFNWNETKQGVILGAFFWGYILFQVVGGRLSEIFGAKWLCAGGVGMSIIINLLTPIIARADYYLFLVSRVALGVSQSVVFPSCYALFAKWAPDHERRY
jgi:MFS family permease